LPKTNYSITSGIFYLFFLLTSALSGADFDAIYNDFQKGNYRDLLEEYHFLAKSWLEEGRFNGFLDTRQDSARRSSERLQKEAHWKKRYARKLKKIETEKNNALQLLCDRYPDVEIMQMVRDILHYHQLREEYADEMLFFHRLELGVVNTRCDPAVAKLQKILLEYQLKSMVVSSQVIDCRINSETAYLHKTLMDLACHRELLQVCRAHTESQVANLCLRALEVQMAMLPVVLNQQYLSDLLVGIRAPANVVEVQTKRILRDTYARKEEVRGQK